MFFVFDGALEPMGYLHAWPGRELEPAAVPCAEDFPEFTFGADFMP